MLLSHSKVRVLWEFSPCTTASQTKKGLKISFSLSPKGPLLCFSSDFRSWWFVFLLSEKESGNWKPYWGCSPASVHQSETKVPCLEAKGDGTKEGVQDGVHSFCANREQYGIHSPCWGYTLRGLLGGWVLDWCGSALHTEQASQGGCSCPGITYRK